MPIPVLNTARLTLRPVTEADAPAYQSRFADYEVVRWLNDDIPWPYPDGGAAEYIRDVVTPRQGTDRWVWGVHAADADGVIGAIDISWRGAAARRGFWLGREFWGRGYMTEAVIAAMDFAFDELGIEAFELNNACGNARSSAVKRRTGAVFVAYRPARYVDPALTEAEIWTLSKADWRIFRRDGPR